MKTMANNDKEYICEHCIDDIVLKNEIRKDGSPQNCFSCGGWEQNKSPCIGIEELADRVHHVFPEYYQGSDMGGSRSTGRRPEEIISDLTLSNDNRNIAAKILKILKEKYPAAYNSDAYEENPIDISRHLKKWEDFCDEVKYKSRYFSPKVIETLDYIFCDIENYEASDGNKVIRELYAWPMDTLYRARDVNVKQTRMQVYIKPSKELYPPPIKDAREGRWNAVGISVFYASFNVETCIAEIRAPIGGIAIVGKFQLTKPLQIFDLTSFKKTLSKFDPNYDYKKGKWAFLSKFHDEVQKPILAQNKHFEYLPTQVVADYFANKFEFNINGRRSRIDGIIYPSAQTDGRGTNIVVFEHALRYVQLLVPKIPSGTQVQEYFEDERVIISDLPELFEFHKGKESLLKTNRNIEQSFLAQTNDEVSDDFQRHPEANMLLVTVFKYCCKAKYIMFYTRNDAEQFRREFENRSQKQ